MCAGPWFTRTNRISAQDPLHAGLVHVRWHEAHVVPPVHCDRHVEVTGA